MSQVNPDTLASIASQTDRVHLFSVDAKSWRSDVVRLAQRLTAAPVTIEYESGGKPYFTPSCGWHFSVSHTAQFGLTAFATSPVGIDCESLNRRVRAEPLARRFFSAAEHAIVARLTSDREQRETFLYFWTAKEAALKLTGHGLSGGLDRCEVLLKPERSGAQVHFERKVFQVRYKRLGGEFLVAVARAEEFQLAEPEVC